MQLSCRPRTAGSLVAGVEGKQHAQGAVLGRFVAPSSTDAGGVDPIDDRPTEIGTSLSEKFHPVRQRLTLIVAERLPPFTELIRDLLHSS